MAQVRNTENTPKHVDFHGAAVIDAEGREIPITEEMVQQACEKLANAWQPPVTAARLAV